MTTFIRLVRLIAPFRWWIALSVLLSFATVGAGVGLIAMSAYLIAKAAVVHMTRCAAMELGEDNVRVNSISPGGIATGIFAKAMGMSGPEAEATAEKVKATLAKLQSMLRSGAQADVAVAGRA